jgi:poly-gamma-glutamate synthesis protein (capsule biosynthesis protein)
LEFYKGKLIAYSLGNFIFTDSRKDTMVLQAEVNKSGVESVRIIPCRIENLRPVLIKDKEESSKLIEKVESLSFDVEINMDGFVDFKKLESGTS